MIYKFNDSGTIVAVDMSVLFEVTVNSTDCITYTSDSGGMRSIIGQPRHIVDDFMTKWEKVRRARENANAHLLQAVLAAQGVMADLSGVTVDEPDPAR